MKLWIQFLALYKPPPALSEPDMVTHMLKRQHGRLKIQCHHWYIVIWQVTEDPVQSKQTNERLLMCFMLLVVQCCPKYGPAQMLITCL